MPKEQPAPTSFQQLLRVLRHEHPLFALQLAKNSASYTTQKYLLGNKTLTKKIHGFYMQFDLTDPGISRSLLLVGDREREHRYILERVIRPNQTVLDLGANIGYYVLLELKLLEKAGHVIAIEPSPSNFERLLDNLKLNHATKSVTTINAAVSDNDGTATLHLSNLSNVHSLIAKQVSKASGKQIEVPAISLSTIQHQHGPIDLIRMDVEGYEQTILRSLIDLNQQQSFLPDILFELHPPTYSPPQFNQLLADLYQLGYRADYLASSHAELLRQHNLTIEASIPTDGTVRHIARHIDLKALQALALNSRAAYLTTKQ